MADEISIRIQTSQRWKVSDFLGEAGILSHNFSPARFLVNQATADKYEEVILVTTGTDVEVLMPDLTSPGICMLNVLGDPGDFNLLIFGGFSGGAVLPAGSCEHFCLFRLDTSVYNLGLESGAGTDTQPLPVQVKVWSD